MPERHRDDLTVCWPEHGIVQARERDAGRNGSTGKVNLNPSGMPMCVVQSADQLPVAEKSGPLEVVSITFTEFNTRAFANV